MLEEGSACSETHRGPRVCAQGWGCEGPQHHIHCVSGTGGGARGRPEGRFQEARCVCGGVLCRSPWGSFLQLDCLGKKFT